MSKVPTLPADRFFSKTAMAMWVGQAHVDRSARRHRHDFTELVLVAAGSGQHVTAQEARPIRIGDVFVVQPWHVHAYRDAEGLTVYNVLYDLAKLDIPERDLHDLPGYRALFDLEPRLRERQGRPTHLRLDQNQLQAVLDETRTIEKELTEQTAGYQFLAKAGLMKLLANLGRLYDRRFDSPSVSLTRLARVLGHIDEHLGQPLRAADLARVAGMSTSTLGRAFHDAFGCGPIDYVIRARLRRAATGLQTTDAPVGEIARDCGFNDPNYFARQFRCEFGVSPRGFRNQHADALAE